MPALCLVLMDSGSSNLLFFDDFINFQQCIIFDSTHDHTVQLIESHYFHPGKSLHIFPLALPMSFITSNFICSRLKMQCSDTNCEFSVSTTVTQWRGEKWKETKKSPICLNRLPPCLTWPDLVVFKKFYLKRTHTK